MIQNEHFINTYRYFNIFRDQTLLKNRSGARLPMLQLTISHSQRFNSGKPLSTGCCEWLWLIATWANGMLSKIAVVLWH